MSGELQTIPARHGVATFVPRGRTIKIVNTYGKQVVSTWAFSLAAPPEEGDGEDPDVTAEELEEKAKELEKQAAQGGAQKKATEEPKPEKTEAKTSDKKAKKGKDSSSEASKKEQPKKPEDKPSNPEDVELPEDPPEQAPDDDDDPPEQAPEDSNDGGKKQGEKRTWSSYIPSIPYRGKGKGSPAKPEAAADPEAEKAEKAESEATSKKWSSYLPTGKSFSSYVPNVQLPDSKEVASSFKASHHRDPNKSYAQQLYDFSRTPVGAASLAAATGSGTASSLYAAYSAYAKMNPSNSSQPPMEYLSLPHTRTASKHLVPEVNDTLLTNLRAPIMTLIEDTTPGAHDTLTAACDASQYAALEVDKPEEHGSCAENLVLALKELNEKAGLKGPKAVGADITVYIAPTPLHLFMNAPIETDTSAQSDRAGARGAKLKIEEPRGKKRSYVRFRAERDMVVVMSACPMDIGPQNGGKPMAANFMVEEVSEEEMAASISSLKNPVPKKEKKNVSPGPKKVSPSPKESPKKEEQAPEKAAETPKNEEESEKKDDVKPLKKPQVKGGPGKPEAVKKSAEAARRDSGVIPDAKVPDKSEQKTGEEPAKPKKKPKKLERRGGSATPSKKAPSPPSQDNSILGHDG